MRLNIGSGPNVFPFDDWINYDRDDFSTYLEFLRSSGPAPEMPAHQQRLATYLRQGGAIDFRVHDLRSGFPQHPDGSIDAIYFGQVIEHLNPIYETPQVLKEFHRMLRPGGVLRIVTPDLDLLIDAYRRGQMERFAREQPEFYKSADQSAQLSYIMFGAAGPGCTRDNYEGHMFLYTRISMHAFLTTAGFTAPVTFYSAPGRSHDPSLCTQVVDAGMSHSFITEAVK